MDELVARWSLGSGQLAKAPATGDDDDGPGRCPPDCLAWGVVVDPVAAGGAGSNVAGAYRIGSARRHGARRCSAIVSLSVSAISEHLAMRGIDGADLSQAKCPGQTRFLLVGPVGIEPTTFGLKARCSAN
jgi:hypothetical protein